MVTSALSSAANSQALDRFDNEKCEMHVIAVADDGATREIPLEQANSRHAAITEAMVRAAQAGPIYLTIDTYLTQVLVKGGIHPAIQTLRNNGALKAAVLDDSVIAGVFPWQADSVCTTIPHITREADLICRNVARYYFEMMRQPVMDGYGTPRKFVYKIANTISYRAYASYQNVAVDLRRRMGPVSPKQRVCQFDWTAAEWSLILQHCGYTLPAGDPYEMFTSAGIARDDAKVVVLAHIYGAALDTLHGRHDPASVDAIIATIKQVYPKVLEWREEIRNHASVQFQCFQIDLGNEPHKRANRWAQTALQLCKWELMHRLVIAGCSGRPAGDLHDQLIFHYEYENPEHAAQMGKLIKEIQSKCFNCYDLRPKLQCGEHWQ